MTILYKTLIIGLPLLLHNKSFFVHLLIIMDDSRLQSSIVATAVESGKAMGSAMKGEGKEEGLAELYKLNQVWYRMPPTLSLVSKRTITKCQFQQSTYAQPLTQKVASAIFNTGEFQVSGKTSFLVIQCGIDKSGTDLNAMFGVNQTAVNVDAPSTALTRSTARAFLGQGGIMNIIDEITFLSASGTEVDRQQNKGLQLSHVTRNRNSQDWYNTSGQIQGYPGGTFQDCYDDKGFPGGMFANPSTSAAGTVTSPWLIPTRTTHTADYSKDWISLASASTGAGTVNYLPTSEFDNTHPYYFPSYLGSVDVSFDPVYDATYNPHPGQAPYFIVPLNDVLGMFSPYMNALIPSQALAGGRVEIRFKDMREALIATGPPFAANTVAGTTGSWSGGTSGSTASTSNASTFLNALQIYNVYFLLDSFQMNEGTLRRLNEAAAGNEGLSVMFDTWDWTQTPITGTSGEAQVAQARSRILRSFCVIRDQANITNPWANSLASEAAINRIDAQGQQYSLQSVGAGLAAGYQQLLVTKYQAVLGSLYFPQQPLGTVEEFLMNSYYVWGKTWQDSMEISAVSLGEFIGANGGNFQLGASQIVGLYTPGGGNSTSTAVAPIQTSTKTLTLSGVNAINATRTWSNAPPPWALNWGSATYGFLAERSQLLQLSGLPISNARLLRHQFVFSYVAASGQPRLVDVFTEYTRVMKVFLGGRIVMRE